MIAYIHPYVHPSLGTVPKLSKCKSLMVLILEEILVAMFVLHKHIVVVGVIPKKIQSENCTN